MALISGAGVPAGAVFARGDVAKGRRPLDHSTGTRIAIAKAVAARLDSAVLRSDRRGGDRGHAQAFGQPIIVRRHVGVL